MRAGIFAFLCLAVAAQTSQEQPREFAPGTISTGRGFTVSFSADSANVYFTAAASDTPPGKRPTLHIYRSHFDRKWQPAKALSFSSDHWSDLDPFVTPDGRRMYFVSTRPAPGKNAAKPDMDIWFSERKGDSWSQQHYIAEINSDRKEGSPSLDRSNNLYFFSDRGREANRNSIYISRWRNGHFSAPEKLPSPVNSESSDTSPWIAPDGQTLFFYSDRPGGAGEGDLYVAFLKNGKWSQPQDLGRAVNSADSEYNPEVSRDGATFYFGRDGRIFSIPVEALHVPGLTAESLK